MNLLVIGIGHEKDVIIGYRYRFKFFISCIPSSNSIWYNPIITHMAQLIGFFLHQQIAAQHSKTCLVFAVAVAAHIRNPPPSPAPPV